MTDDNEQFALSKNKPFCGVLNNWWIDDDRRCHGNLEKDCATLEHRQHRFGSGHLFEDGEAIVTSIVMALDEPYIETRASIYKLGEPRRA